MAADSSSTPAPQVSASKALPAENPAARPFEARVSPRLATLAPAFTLSNPGQSRTPMWRSQEALGEYSLRILFVGTNKTWLKADAAPTFLSFAQAASQNPADRFLIVSSDKAWLQQAGSRIKSGSAPAASFLWDENSIARSNLGLQQGFGISPAQSALLAIDRAGWIRSVEKVGSNGQVLALLKEADDPAPKIAAGQPAPDFAITDMNGTLRRLSDLKGKKHLLLTFFPKCFTFTCGAQLTSLRDERANLAKLDVEVWAVSVDPAGGEKGQRAFAKALDLPFPLLSDVGRNVCLLYGAVRGPNQVAARMSVFIDKQGKVAWIDKQINPKTHGADVAAKAREIALAGNPALRGNAVGRISRFFAFPD